MRQTPFLLKVPLLVFAAGRVRSLRNLVAPREHVDADVPAPVFLIGSGRNGSTLLACILNAHPELYIPPEQGAVARALLRWNLTRPSWERFTSDFIEDLAVHSGGWPIDFEAAGRDLLEEDPRRRTLWGALDLVYGRCAHNVGKAGVRWGDKTPQMTHYTRLLKAEFPESRYVFLLRDPRDVVLSHLTANPAYYSERLSFLIWRWKDGIRQLDWLRRSHPEDVFLLRYEDLVRSPREEVAGLLEWLGLPSNLDLTSDFRENVDAMGVGGAQHHGNLHRPISSRSIARWKDGLSPEIARRTQRSLRAEMDRFDFA